MNLYIWSDSSFFVLRFVPTSLSWHVTRHRFYAVEASWVLHLITNDVYWMMDVIRSALAQSTFWWWRRKESFIGCAKIDSTSTPTHLFKYITQRITRIVSLPAVMFFFYFLRLLLLIVFFHNITFMWHGTLSCCVPVVFRASSLLGVVSVKYKTWI